MVGAMVVGSNGRTFSSGDADFYGSTGGLRLNVPIADPVATPNGKG